MVVEPKIPFYEPKLGITKIMTSYPGDRKLARIKVWDVALDEAKKRHAVDMKSLDRYETRVIEMEILTGRTHQIRYHLSQCGLPIVGDYLYGGDDYYQMQLQAYKLSFTDPDGEEVSVEVDMPLRDDVR